MILESNVSYFYSQQKSSLSYFVFELHIFINMKKKTGKQQQQFGKQKTVFNLLATKWQSTLPIY